MREIHYEDFEICPIIESARKENISDSVYFSQGYSNFISNSRLKLINPDEGGSPELYFGETKKITTQSLSLGSAVHELFLQKDEFNLIEGHNKPTAKAGMVIDRIIHHRKQNKPILTAVKDACDEVGYYAKSFNEKHLKNLITVGLEYYWKSRSCTEADICLSNRDIDSVKSCLNSLYNNQEIMKLINPTDMFGEPILSFNEDALFLDVLMKYRNKEIVLKLKMKADNWSIDIDNHILTLNDLKTTGHPIPMFMIQGGSMDKYHYNRQFAMYKWMLSCYCKKEYGFDKSWNFNSNVMVVETINPYRAENFIIPDYRLSSGCHELSNLLKQVAYYELEGYTEEASFQ